MSALFEPDGELLVPTEAARGPWDPAALHGGPTAALVARAAEHHWRAGGGLPPGREPAAEGASGEGWALARLTVELLRPVPCRPLALEVHTTRPGRRVSLAAVSVRSGGPGGQEVARAVTLGIRRRPVGLPARLTRPAEPPVGPEALTTASIPAEGSGEWRAFHNSGVEMRWEAGLWRQPGPARVWLRLLLPVVAGEKPSPAVRAAALADFGNGISSELDFNTWRFLNPELTVHLARDPVGEWVRLDARTLLGPDGGGLAEAGLSDIQGPFGRASQALFIDRA